MGVNVESLKLAGGRHYMICPYIITKTTMQKENAEIDKILAALHLSNTVPRQYAILNKEPLHSAQLGNGQYPTVSSHRSRSKSNNSRDKSITA